MSKGYLTQGKKIVGIVPLPEGTRDDTLPRPRVPSDVIPFDQTPRPDGLAVDASIGDYVLARVSPRRWGLFARRWPEVVKFDERVTELEARQASVNDRIDELNVQHRAAVLVDKETLAHWVADPNGPRPKSTVPAIEQEITESIDERDALTLAMQNVLDEKIAYVTKHSVRLQAEAAEARGAAVKDFLDVIALIAERRAEVVGCIEAEHWAKEYPAEGSDAGRLQLSLVRGGRVVKRWIPALDRASLVWDQVVALLRAEADWLVTALDLPAEADSPESTLWLDSPEGLAAQAQTSKKQWNKLTADRMKNVVRAGWGE